MLHPRARTMLLLSLPAVAIGIASSRCQSTFCNTEAIFITTIP
ncbi:hypothetical protein ACUOAQ_01775, partial [Escherichia sp. SP-MK]